MSSSILRTADVIGGRYRIEAYVDAGGMQEVYRATDVSLQRVVALKVPKNESAKKRFQRSAAMSAKVTHPNVAKTFDYLEESGRQYLVEEFVDGQDLKLRLASHFAYLDPHLAAHVFHHFAKGLAAVHRVGVIHRDLKPSNVMVSTDPSIETVKITDFGVAKMAEAEVEEALEPGKDPTLGSPTVVGALPYMAPEVIKNVKGEINLCADVWSAGAILYQLLTGQRPFGEGLMAVERILKGDITPKPELLSQNPQFTHLVDGLWSIVIKCLVLKPEARPTAAELVELCGQLSYSSAERHLGVIANYKGGTGRWGFISYGEGDTAGQAFFHESSYWGKSPEVGTRVSFAKFPGSPASRAFPVLPLKPE